MIFEGKKCYWTWNVCFDFLYSSWLRELWFWEELSEILSQTYIHLYVKYPLFLSDCNQTWIFLTDFREKKYSNIKFHENLSSGSRLFHAERRTDRQTDRHYEASNHFLQFFESTEQSVRCLESPARHTNKSIYGLSESVFFLGVSIAKKNRYFPESFSEILPLRNKKNIVRRFRSWQYVTDARRVKCGLHIWMYFYFNALKKLLPWKKYIISARPAAIHFSNFSRLCCAVPSSRVSHSYFNVASVFSAT